MSLATRCNACGTMFRVVQDQLRVSEGWVRCGRCDVVFNALDALIDLEAEAAAAAAEEAAADADLIETIAADEDSLREPERLPSPQAAPSVADSSEPWLDEDVRYQASAAEHALDPEPAPPAPGFQTLPPTPTSAPYTGAGAPTASTTLQRSADATPATSWVPLSEVAATAVPAKPGFVKDAERNARWQSPAMRAALISLSLMLMALLAGQAAFHFRDALAARSPAAASLLTAVCARWGCRVEALRRIEDVTLEGSGLSRIAQQPQAIKLSISLRNRGSTDLALPSIDLSLNDANGKLIARRALSPRDFKVDPPLIRRGAELPLELVLSTGERQVSAYTVELFYP